MWVANIWLFLCWLWAPVQYEGLKAMGATCYVWVAPDGAAPAGEMPACWYGDGK